MTCDVRRRDGAAVGPGPGAGSTAITRLSAQDATTLATDVGPAPAQIGALLWLDTPDGVDADRVVAAMADRVAAVPRLRQRLWRVPAGCGRPVWVDDDAFDIRHHVTIGPPARDRAAVLDQAAALLTSRLPGERALWSATFVPVPSRRETALVLVCHHVLADGVGGLAVLAVLVDGRDGAHGGDEVHGGDGVHSDDRLHGRDERSGPAFPAPAPSLPAVALDAMRQRWRTTSQLRRLPASLRAASAELRASGRTRASRSSLNRPTGPRRQLAVTRVELDRIRDTAHAHGGSVNDVVLAAVAGALDRLLAHRGERVDRLVASVPVSGRRGTTAAELGNDVGVAPIELPCRVDPVERLRTVVGRGRLVRDAPRGASAQLLGPVFRVLAHLGVFGWLVDRQRLVNTFVTNLRGPDSRLAVLGAPVTEVLPLVGLAGNVTVAFGVLSYAGTLSVTVAADPAACPDLGFLRDALQEELDAYGRLRS